MIEHRNGDPIDVLLVEDNPGDVRLTQEAFKEGRINNTLYVVTTGDAALDFLYQRGEHTSVPRPDIVLLDLNLPTVDGMEILEEIKNDPDLKPIPVVILTSSGAQEDIVKSYKLHTNAYLTKPVSPSKFISLVHSFEEFWFTLVRLPPSSDDESHG